MCVGQDIQRHEYYPRLICTFSNEYGLHDKSHGSRSHRFQSGLSVVQRGGAEANSNPRDTEAVSACKRVDKQWCCRDSVAQRYQARES